MWTVILLCTSGDQSEPCALIPIAGVPLADHWLSLSRQRESTAFKILTTKTLYRSLYQWSLSRRVKSEDIITLDDATLCNHENLVDIFSGRCIDSNFLVIKDNILFSEGFDFNTFLSDIYAGIPWHYLDDSHLSTIIHDIPKSVQVKVPEEFFKLNTKREYDNCSLVISESIRIIDYYSRPLLAELQERCHARVGILLLLFVKCLFGYYNW